VEITLVVLEHLVLREQCLSPVSNINNLSAHKHLSILGTTVATLLSSGTVRAVTGEDVVFVYRIALPEDDDVLESLRVVVTNVDVSGSDVSMIVDQGNDIYHVIFPQVVSVLDQAEFVLEYNEFTITSIARIAVLCKLY